MNLSEMRDVLARRGIRLTKSLGQNFLHDGNQLRRILAAAELKPSDQVLEVGPGLGPLTELLLAQTAEVLAVEKDARLVDWLRERFAQPGSHSGRLQLVHDDVLRFLERNPRDWTAWKLVSNLPYSVASAILVELAHQPQGPQRVVATLQLEVAKRLMAAPGQADYGLLTLLVQVRYAPQGWFKIPPGSFFPEPDVDSACICLKRRDEGGLTPGQHRAFVSIVKRSFSQRRKMMLKLLKNDWPEADLQRIFQQVGLPLQARAETLRLEDFVQLTQALELSSKGIRHDQIRNPKLEIRNKSQS